MENSTATKSPVDLKTKGLLRFYYIVVLVIVWLTMMAAGIYNMAAFRSGSPSPTVDQTEPLSEHGRRVYVTHAESKDIHFLNTVVWIGVGTAVVIGCVLAYFRILPGRRNPPR